MKRYLKYAKPYWPYFVLAPIMMVSEVIGDVLLPYLTSRVINVGAQNKDNGYIILIGIVMILTAIGMMVVAVSGAYFATKASVNFAGDLRTDVFQKIQKFSFSNIDRFSTGSLVTRLTNDVTQVQNMIMMLLRMMLRAPGMLIGAVIMAFFMNAELAFIIFIMVPILAVVIFVIISKAFPRFTLMQNKLDKLNSGIQEALTNVRVIKSFVRGEYEEQKFEYLNEDLRDTSIRAFRLMILQQPFVMLIMHITTILVVWFGGNQIMIGKMPVGDLTAFITYITQVLMALNMLSVGLMQSSRALASARRISEVLDEKIDLTDDGADAALLVTKGKVEFRNVSFKYYKDNQQEILEHINFILNPGETVGIIGSTGSGKTTLVQMIPRLYDVDKGEVLVDDRNVKEYKLENLRNGVGVVLQKNVLFSGTILENLRWGNDNATLEEVKEAAKAAQADQFISTFPDGYETELGQGGVNVSGGQKQRLCIARALLKKPKILILDDSTSAVDTATERHIRKSFYTTLKNTTKIIIAQRISSVIEADKIVVLDEGTVVGIGTHKQLMAQCKPYQEIYYSQMDKEDDA